MKRLLLGLSLYAILAAQLFAAASLDLTTPAGNKPNYLADVTTSATYTIVLKANYRYTFSHTGKQDDGSASVVGDYVVLMHQADTMAANLTTGAKSIIFVNGYVCMRGADAKAGTDGDYEVALKAVTHGAKIQITCVPDQPK